MDNLISLRWCGPRAAVLAALAALGDPRHVTMIDGEDGPMPTVQPDPRVAAFGPVDERMIVGVGVTFSLILATEEIALPASLELADDALSRAVVGDFMPAPPRLVPTGEWFERVSEETQFAVATSDDPQIRYLMVKVQTNKNLDLDDARIAAGLTYAVNIGLLTEEERRLLLA